MIKLPPEVEREFDERFGALTQRFHTEDFEHFYTHSCTDECLASVQIKSFFAQALANQREELAKEIERQRQRAEKYPIQYPLGFSREGKAYNDGYNQALTAAADLMRGKGKR